MYDDLMTLGVDTNPDPYGFFSTAAGPDIADLVGPPQSVLDVYGDGTPISAAESAVAQGVGGGGPVPFWRNAAVISLVWLAVGAIGMHLHMEAE